MPPASAAPVRPAQPRARLTVRTANKTAAVKPPLFHLNRRYYRPSKEARTLAILDALRSDSGLTQHELAQRVHMSGAMVNHYLRELEDEGLIEFEPLNGKSYRYVLTPEGNAARVLMFSVYSSETIQLYSALKSAILAKLTPLRRAGLTKIVLFGAAETCEVLLSAIQDEPFEIAALLDNDPAKHGRVFHGHVISPPEVLESLRCQAVVIATFGQQEEIHAQIAPVCREKGLEIVRL